MTMTADPLDKILPLFRLCWIVYTLGREWHSLRPGYHQSSCTRLQLTPYLQTSPQLRQSREQPGLLDDMGADYSSLGLGGLERVKAEADYFATTDLEREPKRMAGGRLAASPLFVAGMRQKCRVRGVIQRMPPCTHRQLFSYTSSQLGDLYTSSLFDGLFPLMVISAPILGAID
jgi:hypothetical protein